MESTQSNPSTNAILLTTLIALSRNSKSTKAKPTERQTSPGANPHKIIANHDDRIFNAIHRTAIHMCRNLDVIDGEYGNVCRGFAAEIAEKGLEWASCRYTETELRELLYGPPNEVKRRVEILALSVAKALGLDVEDDGEGGILLKT